VKEESNIKKKKLKKEGKVKKVSIKKKVKDVINVSKEFNNGRNGEDVIGSSEKMRGGLL
jgi:hypothetical protein